MRKKVLKKDIERVEKTLEELKSIMKEIKEYCPNALLVCYPTSGSINLVYNNGEDDLYKCKSIVSVYVDCDACS